MNKRRSSVSVPAAMPHYSFCATDRSRRLWPPGTLKSTHTPRKDRSDSEKKKIIITSFRFMTTFRHSSTSQKENPNHSYLKPKPLQTECDYPCFSSHACFGNNRTEMGRSYICHNHRWASCRQRGPRLQIKEMDHSIRLGLGSTNVGFDQALVPWRKVVTGL